jgi:hypothetical protein
MFHDQGHRVLMAESQKYFLGRPSSAVAQSFHVSAPNSGSLQYAQELAQICESEKVAELIPTCEEVFHLAKHRELFLNTRVWCHSAGDLRTLHSKYLFQEQVEALGFLAPRTEVYTSLPELKARLNEIGSEKVVLKPEFSRFASQTIIGYAREINFTEDIGPHRPWVLQEFIAGREICTYSVAWAGALLTHACYEHEFTAGRGAGICFEALEIKAVENWCARFVAETGFSGQISFDFIQTDDGRLFPLECNPRATSGLHLMTPADLTSVFLEKTPSHRQPLKPKPSTKGKITLAMILYGIFSINSFKRLRIWARMMLQAREVIFSLRDPAPFLEQFVCLFYFWIASLRHKTSMLEVSTLDIEWNGEP